MWPGVSWFHERTNQTLNRLATISSGRLFCYCAVASCDWVRTYHSSGAQRTTSSLVARHRYHLSNHRHPHPDPRWPLHGCAREEDHRREVELARTRNSRISNTSIHSQHYLDRSSWATNDIQRSEH